MSFLKKFENTVVKTPEGEEVKFLDILAEALVEAGAVKGADGSIKFPAAAAESKAGADSALVRAQESITFIKSILENKATPNTGAGSFGAIVPTGLYNKVIEKRDQVANFRKYAMVVPVAGSMQFGAEATQPLTYWVGENVDITEAEPTLAKINLEDWYLACRVLIPFKLLDGSPLAVEDFFARIMGRAIARAEDAAILNGDNSSKPNGIRNTITTTVAQAGATLAYDDVVNGYYGLGAQYRANSIAVTSALGAKALRKIKDTTGAPIFSATDNTVFGRPLVETANMAENLGGGANTTEIVFVDPSYIVIKDGSSLSMMNQGVDRALQTQLVAFEAIDSELTLAEAGVRITGVK